MAVEHQEDSLLVKQQGVTHGGMTTIAVVGTEIIFVGDGLAGSRDPLRKIH
jgi:hypothetical protein